MASRASGATTSARIGSSTVAIGTATVFIAIAAGLSFVADDGTGRAPAAWTLRGSIASEPAPSVPALAKVRQVERQRVARSDFD